MSRNWHDSPFPGAPLGAAAMAESIKEESSMGFEKWRASVVSMAENPPGYTVYTYRILARARGGTGRTPSAYLSRNG